MTTKYKVPHWTTGAGLTPKGAQQAQPALDKMISMLSELGHQELADAVYHEACYRVFRLVERSIEFQRAYLKAQEG